MMPSMATRSTPRVASMPWTAVMRPYAHRQLLGFGVLVLTVIPGYVGGRMSGAHEIPRSTRGNTPSGMIGSHIKDVASRHGISVDLIAAIIETESHFNPRAVSHRGARGLMQLMPATAAILGVRDPFDPRENIEGGVQHLRSLMVRFDNNLPLVLAAYNAGEQAVIAHGGIPPYRETQEYVRRVLGHLRSDRAKAFDRDRAAARSATRGKASSPPALLASRS